MLPILQPGRINPGYGLFPGQLISFDSILKITEFGGLHFYSFRGIIPLIISASWHSRRATHPFAVLPTLPCALSSLLDGLRWAWAGYAKQDKHDSERMVYGNGDA
jgi:hypothetical protein